MDAKQASFQNSFSFSLDLYFLFLHRDFMNLYSAVGIVVSTFYLGLSKIEPSPLFHIAPLLIVLINVFIHRWRRMVQ